MGFCNGGIQCSTPAENVVDADMNGIGVVLSFVITAAISVIVAIMAVLKRAIPKQQYLRLDEKVLYWIGVRRPASDSPSNLGYQSLLLALSDQMLAVGLCYLIAIHEQGHSVSRNAILRRIYSSEKERADLQTFLEKDEEERRRRTQKDAATMERRPGFWKAFCIVTVPIIGLFYQGVDTKPLLMTSFGQIMPMLLLLVIALTAVEIGTIKNFRGIEIEIEVKKHPVSIPNTARRVTASEGYASSSQEMTSGLSQSRTGISA
ncbi:uncharacterized protein FTOL_02717 [Fusarium torulosum]|uniref:Uncharacterized protein n=1 Tax=Fusarium torulosum TaxID=33205 RepID=A0AAE8SEN6_9HYPO|nr:uncharacterized protein FTOL_02717 [Fusarium torulosum]